MKFNRVLVHPANLISSLLPQTRGFAFRRWLFRRTGVRIAPQVRINGGVVFQFPNVSIGARTWVGRRTEFVSTTNAQILIGADCDVSQDVLFMTGSHEIAGAGRRAGRGDSRSISVGDGTWIGARVTMLGGSSVGSGVVVAAGALVRDEFPDNVLIAGVPARVIRTLE